MRSETTKAAVTPGEIIPAEELLADLYMLTGKHKEALKSYELNLKGRPFRFNGLYGAAKAAQKLDNNELAAYYFEKLIKVSEDVNSSRPELSEAKDFLANNSNSKNV